MCKIDTLDIRTAGSRQLQGLQDMEVDNAVDDPVVPEGPASRQVLPVSFQQMEVDINAVKAEVDAIEESMMHARREMEGAMPGSATREPPDVGAGDDTIDPQDVKAKLRAKLQRKSAEAKLLQDIETSLAEEMNATSAEEGKSDTLQPPEQSKNIQQEGRMQTRTRSHHQKTNVAKQVNDARVETASQSVPKHTTDNYQDL